MLPIQRQTLRLQPMVDLCTQRVVGFEGLSGMNANGGSLRCLTVDALIAAILESSPLTSGQFLSVNLENKVFFEECAARKILAALDAAYFSPSQLILEIGETLPTVALGRARSLLAEFCKRGIHIALDDFGTERSTLSLLVDIPADFIKIDKRFIQASPVDTASRAILKHTIALVKEVGKRSIIEGIEDSIQLQIATDLGADWGQGYYLGMPRNFLSISPPSECIFHQHRVSALPDDAKVFPEAVLNSGHVLCGD